MNDEELLKLCEEWVQLIIDDAELLKSNAKIIHLELFKKSREELEKKAKQLQKYREKLHEKTNELANLV